MILPLFVYGTLSDPELFATLLGRPLRWAHFHAACAPGFRAVERPGGGGARLLRSPGGTAPGRLVTDLTPFEFDLLAAFEGPEHVAGMLAVMVEEELFEAAASLPQGAGAAQGREFSLARWQAADKPGALAAARLEAAHLRQRLIAVRPH